MQRTAEGSFLASSVCGFLFVHEMYSETLNGFAPNSHRRHVKVKVTSDKKMEFFIPFSGLHAVYVW